MTDALAAAATQGDLARVRELLAGGSLDGQPASKALVDAVIYGHLEVARALLDHGADPNHRYGYERTALSFAVTSNVAIVDLLLARGADINARDSVGLDVLHAYLLHVGPGQRLGSADVGVVRRLIEAGLDVRARNADVPHLPMACAAASVPVLELLLAAGADPNVKDRRDSSVFWEAIKSSNRGGVFAALVKGGIDANTRCTNAAVDTTILTEVCAASDLASARTLLDRGADPNAEGRSTPLARAQESDNAALIDLLLERGARPLLPSLSAEATYALDLAQRDEVQTEDPRARLAWAEALLQAGFRAAAASEVAALGRRGVAVPAELTARLAFEAPAGVRWTFADFQPTHDGVAPRTSDARFPGARVTDGVRIVPLVLTKGGACTACDERGEVVCSACHGTGWFSCIYNDDPTECGPRMRCTICRGLKFAVTGERLGKGACTHPRVKEEMKVGDYSFRRCQTCGLAALHGAVFYSGSPDASDFACGVCGHFVCSCRSR